MALTSSLFAEYCVRYGFFFGVHPHYLAACGLLRTGIVAGPVGAAQGPFRVAQDFWDANLSDNDFDVALPAQDINVWRSQCIFAGLTARHALDAFIARENRYPSTVELYAEQWPDAADGTVQALQAALAATAALIPPAIVNVTGQPPAGPSALPTPQDGVEPRTNEPHGPQAAPWEQLFVSKARWVMERLMDDFGLEDFQAAGILGNIGHECAGFHTLQEVGGGGYGWAQWSKSRRTSFLAFCEANGLARDSDAANYRYLKLELEGDEKDAIAALMTAKTLATAVRAFEKEFERAKVKAYEKRERWATLALATFKRSLPLGATKLLDPNAGFKVMATATDAGVRYWLVEAADEAGDQAIITVRDGQPPALLARDTDVLSTPEALTLPPAVRTSLSRGAPPPDPPPPPPPPASATRSALLLQMAQACSGHLATANVPGTSRGRLACAWAVNEVARRALGAPIGGGRSTKEMARVLGRTRAPLPANALPAGTIVISPTNDHATGHVGILGAGAGNTDTRPIYSNSSRRGLFCQNYTLGSWKARFRNLGLPVLFYEP